ncbi:MAG: HAD-IA family hydrolase [Spirochaetales bacterium]|nr:HAD-IA family hydrolase [Spirochaetales bacterium]
MSLRDFRVLTFDVVGTLIDFEGGMLDYLRRAVPSAANQVDDEAFLKAYRKARSSDSSGWYPDDLVRVWLEIARELGLPEDHELAEGFRDSVRVWRPFSDSVEALKRLGTRFRLVAMTNTQRWALAHFERALGNPFNDSVSSDDALCEKPDPQFFAFARGRLSRDGYTIRDILHVAQSQYHDIGVAHRLGYAVCWIERRYGKSGFGGTKAVEHLTEPDFHFHTLGELADAVDSGDA